MKKTLLLLMTLLTVCGSFQGLDPQNVYPTRMPTPMLAVLSKPIVDAEKEEAMNFFYELKIQLALGEYEHFAEEVRYPITIPVDGIPKSYTFAAELEEDFGRIFSEEEIQTFISTDEFKLVFTSEGVKLPDDKVWFDLICMDPACNEAEFLITEINN